VSYEVVCITVGQVYKGENKIEIGFLIWGQGKEGTGGNMFQNEPNQILSAEKGEFFPIYSGIVGRHDFLVVRGIHFFFISCGLGKIQMFIIYSL
jgi:hypothetical protein